MPELTAIELASGTLQEGRPLPTLLLLLPTPPPPDAPLLLLMLPLACTTGE